jgi:HK97 family phage portal protein
MWRKTVGLRDFLTRPGGWGALPAPAALAIPDQKALTFNGAEYVPPLFSGPGATEAYEAFIDGYAGRVDGNSAVFACLMALSLAYFEPPVTVYKLDRKGNRDPVPDHPLQALLDHPNDWHTAKELWFWVGWALNLDGNAYLEKVRAGARGGNVVQLIPRSPTMIKPLTDRTSGNLIDRYRFTYAPGKFLDIPAEDMLHLRLGIDDRDHRLGLAPIKRLVRHVCGDDEAARFATTLLSKFGIPGLVVSMPGAAPSRDEAEAIKQRIAAAYGADNRGNVGVLFDGATMSQFGFSPEQLNLKALHQIPETRIAAVMRVPPAVAGLSVGLEQTSNFASFAQVRELFVENTLAPLWALRDDKLNDQFRDDFGLDGFTVATDLAAVRALQEDQNALHTRANADLASGGVSLNEYRTMLGLDPLPPEQGDCHLLGGRFVRRDEIGAAPEPASAPADGPQQDQQGLRVVGGAGA